MIMEGEDTPNRAYWQHFRDDLNSLHPSCGVATPTPMDTDAVQTVTYREDRGPSTRVQARRETRRDRERRRGMAREEERRDRHRGERDQERARGANRRQRDRRDRAYQNRNQGPPRKN